MAIPDPTIIIEPSQEYPYGAIGYNQIAGKPLQPEDVTPNLEAAIAAQIAEFISEVHQVPVDAIQNKIKIPSYLPSDREFDEL
jgi:hypothetical protein